MNLEKRGLDERQREYRNRVGSQCFLLMLYGVLLDMVLYGLGVRWLPYPSNMMTLLTVCAAVYQVRITLGGADSPPGEKPSSGKRKKWMAAGLSLLVAAAAAMVAVKSGLQTNLDASAGQDNSG